MEHNSCRIRSWRWKKIVDSLSSPSIYNFFRYACGFLGALKKFNSIFRFLNTAEIAPYVSGANYTFFVPIDHAFVKHGLEELTEEDLTTEQANRFLLNYFIKGRLYDRDLKHDEVFDSIGGAGLKIQRLPPGELLSSQRTATFI